MVNLSMKERMLLQDEKSHEELCVEKYNRYSDKACDVELKNLFSTLAQKEQQHLDTINQMLSGSVPSVNQGQQSNQNQTANQNQTSMQNMNMNNATNSQLTQNDISNDKMLCQDSLSTEKYVSSTYNTTIFEFKDKNMRQVLNHIQKEEQEHGEQLYNYMSQHGMYN
ncbi:MULTISPECIES: spore coat protein [Clostridium]|uniref:Spore coat protein n=1 Tax=Clostridium aquiflavi TaxID=3073603 RepID=A0ABU1EGH0_9CLOT|nr:MULTISPECIES: spore coat protein [unclassified Clostridium]MDR5587486.1 spore coat protein [Clostridium sp. 5N-1]NFG63008.1 spore coat protein [Clostridium botulinum]NFQ09324.1 spore coat protein [Clostridium botulinum]